MVDEALWFVELIVIHGVRVEFFVGEMLASGLSDRRVSSYCSYRDLKHEIYLLDGKYHFLVDTLVYCVEFNGKDFMKKYLMELMRTHAIVV